MKTTFETAKIELIRFGAMDIIATSIPVSDDTGAGTGGQDGN